MAILGPYGLAVADGGATSTLEFFINASALLPRTGVGNDGIRAFFGNAIADNPFLASALEGNDWSARGVQRDPGVSAVAEAITYTSVAFGDSGLQSENNGIPNTWVGVRTSQVAAGSESIAAGERHVYYLNEAGSQYFGWWTITTGGSLSIFSFLEDFLRNDVTWAHVYSDINTSTAGTGRFANDAAVTAFIEANRAYFQGRDAEDSRTLRVAYFNTTSSSVRIGEVTFVAGVAGVAASPLEVVIDETAEEVEIRYANEAVAGTPVATADNLEDILDAINAYNDRGLYAVLAGSATNSQTFTRENEPAWLVPFSGAESDSVDSAFYALGPEQNVFMGTAESDADTARDTYATANPTWKATYQGDQRLFIILRWGSTGDQKAQVLSEDGTVWHDISFAFIGRTGRTGTPGRAGKDAVASVIAFLESASAPSAPTVAQDATNALTFSGSWSLDYPGESFKFSLRRSCQIHAGQHRAKHRGGECRRSVQGHRCRWHTLAVRARLVLLAEVPSSVTRTLLTALRIVRPMNSSLLA